MASSRTPEATAGRRRVAMLRSNAERTCCACGRAGMRRTTDAAGRPALYCRWCDRTQPAPDPVPDQTARETMIGQVLALGNQALAERNARIAELEAALAQAEAQRQDLAAEITALRAELAQERQKFAALAATVLQGAS